MANSDQQFSNSPIPSTSRTSPFGSPMGLSSDDDMTDSNKFSAGFGSSNNGMLPFGQPVASAWSQASSLGPIPEDEGDEEVKEAVVQRERERERYEPYGWLVTALLYHK